MPSILPKVTICLLLVQYFSDEANKRQLYHGSMYLREQVMSVTSPAVWPADSKDLTTEHAMEMVLVGLFNLLVWMCGTSINEVWLDKFADVSGTVKRKILATAQDILHVANSADEAESQVCDGASDCDSDTSEYDSDI